MPTYSPTEVVFSSHLPLFNKALLNEAQSQTSKNRKGSNHATLLIFDRKLDFVCKEFRRWRQQFKMSLPVTSGESLKEVAQLPKYLARISKLTAETGRDLRIVAAGGGSVGDFAGFVASVYRRGVPLEHVPSTWLAALDSSHGGKTALNLDGVKNQVGSFYPAERVHLVESLLFSQPTTRVVDGFGELAKIALIDGGEWVRRLERSEMSEAELIWQFLRPAVESKYKVVKQDPFEKNGHRQILNLGHTLGHVLESARGVSHGRAVGFGLQFAVEFSRHRGLLADRDFERITRLLQQRFLLQPLPSGLAMREAEIKKRLVKDKKRLGDKRITFIFIKGVGLTSRVLVALDELLIEARRQGWVRR